MSTRGSTLSSSGSSAKKTKKYAWKNGWHNRKMDVQLVGEEIEKLVRLHPTKLHEKMIEVGADPKNPLHLGFTWDDTKAARARRLEEARHLHNAVTTVRVVYLVDKAPTFVSEVPLVVAFRTPQEPQLVTHLTFDDALSSPERRGRMLEDALLALEGFRRRYERLGELSEVFKVIDKTLKALKVDKTKAA
jgi:hypothetical protein